MTRDELWSRAYARQARADFATFELLGRHPEIPQCQCLHFFQMACEKLVKAHLCRRGTTPEVLRASHAYIAHTLPTIARQQFAHLGARVPKNSAWIMRRIGDLAREVELLAPSVDDGGRRPDNCEYPWEDDGGRPNVPAEFEFPNLNLLGEPSGRLLIKLVKSSIDQMA